MTFDRLLTLAIAAAGALGIALNLAGASAAVPLYVGAGGLALAAAMHLTPGIGAFLRFFVVFYGVGYVGIIAALLLAGVPGLGWLSAIPPLTAFTSAAFGVLAILLARIPVTRGVFKIADPYFETADRGTLAFWPLGKITASERWIAFVLLGIIIIINLAQVGISVGLNQWNRAWFDSIQAKDSAEFWRLLLHVWVGLAALFVTSNVIEYILVSIFKIRWRRWATERYVSRWLGDSNHYAMLFNGSVDNPDQRIQEDINKYVENTYRFTIEMISQISNLVSFAVILWGLSAALTIPGTEKKLPGLLLWIAIIYAGLATLVTHLIGKRLIKLNFEKERNEASFRFSLARLREFSEPVALLKGEAVEIRSSMQRFGLVLKNFMEIVGVYKWLYAFTATYNASNQIVPYVIVAPFYFGGQVTLGIMTQTASAFGRVETALSFFIDRYSTLAEYKAVVDRLTSFEASIDKAGDQRDASAIAAKAEGAGDLTIPALSLALPNGAPLVDVAGLALRKGERTLLTGPSGSGKSTLFRAIAGIWPFGKGEVDIPKGADVMLLPQRPYIPIGSLGAGISYPAAEGAFSQEAILAALDAVRLSHLKPRLDEEANWSQILSGGEQQRLSVARAMLAKPAWLFLDEATSALDEPLEAAIYAAIRDHLTETTVISIGHRSSLIGMHDRQIAMQPQPNGTYTIRDVTA